MKATASVAEPNEGHPQQVVGRGFDGLVSLTECLTLVAGAVGAGFGLPTHFASRLAAFQLLWRLGLRIRLFYV